MRSPLTVASADRIARPSTHGPPLEIRPAAALWWPSTRRTLQSDSSATAPTSGSAVGGVTKCRRVLFNAYGRTLGHRQQRRRNKEAGQSNEGVEGTGEQTSGALAYRITSKSER